MRILQVVSDRDRRGAQVYALDLQAGLIELGCEIETVALAPGEHGDLLPIEALGPARWSPWTLRALRDRSRHADVVVAHGSATLPACGLALLGLDTNFIYRQISDPLFWAASAARRLRVGLYLRRAAEVVSLSGATAAAVRDHYRLPEEMVTVIPNAVPGENFRPPSAAEAARARSQFGLDDSLVTVGYVGALVPEKGVDLLVGALGDMDGVQLLVAGDGPERSRLEDLASSVLPDRVVFVGPVVRAIEAYWACDVVVLPTRGGDSMPAVLIEAGLSGRPVVATPVGAIPDVVVSGATGLLVPIDDGAAVRSSIQELATDSILRQRLGHAADTHCRARFTIAATAPQWQVVLERHGRHGA